MISEFSFLGYTFPDMLMNFNKNLFADEIPKSTSSNTNEFNIKLKTINNIRTKSHINIMDYTKKSQKELKVICKERSLLILK